MTGKELENYFKIKVYDLPSNEYDEFFDKVNEYAKLLSEKKVTTTMIRKVYFKIMKVNSVDELKLLRPHIMYIAGRHTESIQIKHFMNLLDKLIKNCKEDGLKNFKRFMEAIVAYRKYYGKDQ